MSVRTARRIITEATVKGVERGTLDSRSANDIKAGLPRREIERSASSVSSGFSTGAFGS